jgi:hypothetical protein
MTRLDQSWSIHRIMIISMLTHLLLGFKSGDTAVKKNPILDANLVLLQRGGLCGDSNIKRKHLAVKKIRSWMQSQYYRKVVDCGETVTHLLLRLKVEALVVKKNLFLDQYYCKEVGFCGDSIEI